MYPLATTTPEQEKTFSAQTSLGGIINNVAPQSIAEALGLQPGDIVLEVNQHKLRDVIDYRFATAEEDIMLRVQTAEGEIIFDIEKDPDEELGIEFTENLFDRLRTCHNACPFCFVAQLPTGLRKTLYVNDDDFRLSFLYGNFITLTNMREADWRRIAQQHLSPLYISVHATDQSLRAKLLGRRTVPDILAQIRRLGNAGIQIHTQIVAWPDVNDGDALHQTIQDLAALYPVVQSVAVVPVGTTRFGSPRARDMNLMPLQPYTVDQALNVLDSIQTYGNQYQHQKGIRFVYPGDEFFLLCGQNVPPSSYYDDYPQYFNGVGMTRDFCDGWKQIQHSLPLRLQKHVRVALVCGTLIAPVLQSITDQLNRIPGLEICLVPVVNHFFGSRVTVSGLLSGQDVVAALHTNTYDHALLPRVMFDHTGKYTLDDYRPEDIEENTGIPVTVAGSPEELVDFVQNLA
jgi:putative radical SAM enzyme (TIGR03279 family)